jgi:hypothetical protein
MTSLRFALALAVLFVLPATSSAQPATFERLQLDVVDPVRDELVTLDLSSRGDLKIDRAVGRSRRTAERLVSEPELRTIVDAFVRARVATLPRLLSDRGKTVTLITRAAGRVHAHSATLGAEAPRARGLVQVLLGLIERHGPRVVGERVQVTGAIQSTYGQPLPGHRFAMAVDDGGRGLLAVQNEPFASLVDGLEGAVTVSGRVVDWRFWSDTTLEGSAIEVEWLEGTARRDLEVWMPLAGDLVPTPFARVRAGEAVRVVGVRGRFLTVLTESGLRAFVRRDGLELVRPAAPEPHLQGVVRGLGTQVVIETARGTFPVRLAARPSSPPVPRYWDSLLELATGEQVTLVGHVDPTGHFFDASALIGRADVALSGSIPAGTLLNIRAGRAGGWLAIERLGGAPGVSFVRAADVDVGGWGH